jgi:D-glycero-alpha-D-manno-heptose-7-phosphate kinase
MAYELRDAIGAGQPDRAGDIMDRSWDMKRSLTSGVSSPDIDELYATGRAHGATGGKLLGAGGGGFLLLIAPPDKHAAICGALGGLQEVPVNFAMRGTQIMYLDRPNP